VVATWTVHATWLNPSPLNKSMAMKREAISTNNWPSLSLFLSLFFLFYIRIFFSYRTRSAFSSFTIFNFLPAWLKTNQSHWKPLLHIYLYSYCVYACWIYFFTFFKKPSKTRRIKRKYLNVSM
jgi:hypothetical protein